MTRVFKKSQEMYVYVEVYEPLATTTQPIVAAVSFFRGKSPVFETQPLIVKDGLNAKSKALPVRFAVPLSSLKPGHLPGHPARPRAVHSLNSLEAVQRHIKGYL